MHWSVIFVFPLFTLGQELYPEVIVTGGRIKGILQETTVEPITQYHAFHNIPYAAPPVGNLRFMPPQELTPWNGTLLTQTNYSVCPQYVNDVFEGEEDCLYLHVDTKELLTPGQELKPVMLHIHGGSFKINHAFTFKNDFLIQTDVVVVSINYRLGVLGFLSTNDENAYGNWAIKDVIAALKWVQENIASFGGDPNKVTLYGISSGAILLDSVEMSRLSKGLIHQIIALSGTVLDSIAIQRDPLLFANIFAEYFGVDNSSTSSIVEGLRKVHFKDLVVANEHYNISKHTTIFRHGPFCPSIEIDHPGAAITQKSFDSMRSLDFQPRPFLYVFASNEGSQGLMQLPSNKSVFDTDPTVFVSESLNLQENFTQVGQIIRNFYLGNQSAIGNHNLTKFLGQMQFVQGILKSADLKRQKVHGFLSQFSYKGSFISDGMEGVPHAGDKYFLFSNVHDRFTPQDEIVSKRYVKLLTNFAIKGHPTPEPDELLENLNWLPLNKTHFNYFNIGKTLSKSEWPFRKDYEFWNDIFDKYAQPPLSTF